MMAPIINASISRRGTAILVLVFILVAGTYSYITIAKESRPDIDVPIIYVSTGLEGISPSDSERLLIRPLEQELANVEGLDEMKSNAYLGGGNVILEFSAGFDKDRAIDDVQKAVDRARSELPDSMDFEPKVEEVNFSLFPVLVVTLSGDIPERTLLKIARRLEDSITSIRQVLSADIAGNREELVEIILSPELIESYGLRGEEIVSFFQRSNRLVAAGTLDTGAGKFAIRVPGLFEDVNDIMDMPVRTNGDSVIKVKDIAEIRRTFKDPVNFARLNGERAIALEIVKRTGENVIDTIDMVKTTVEKEIDFLPDEFRNAVNITYTLDESERIKTMLLDLENNVLSAVLLVMIVILIALGRRASLLVGLAVPGAFLSGVLVIYTMGLTVNMVVLFALILSVGMLVDGAVVVTEYADRKMSEGLDKKEAYRLAAVRMAWPITASTATTLSAFFPLMFWPDIVGEFMKYLPLTLIAVLSSSLLMALIFVPVMGTIIGSSGGGGNRDAIKQLAASEKGGLDEIKGFTGIYVRILNSVIKHPLIVIIFAVALLIGVQTYYKNHGNGVEFFPDIEPEYASVLVHARGNLSVYEQDMLVREVENKVLGINGIETVYTRSGKAPGHGSDLAEDVIGQLQIQLEEWGERRKASLILDEIREKTSPIPGIRVEIREQEKGPSSGKDIQIQLSSSDYNALEKVTAVITDELKSRDEIIDVEDSRPLPGIDWNLQVDRAQASKFGIDITLLGFYIRLVTNGLVVADFRPDDSDEEIDIVLRYDTDQRTLDKLDQVRINTADGAVPIGNFVERTPQSAQGTIARVDQKRVITIQANVKDGVNVASQVAAMKKWAQDNKNKLDKSVEINFRGQNEDQNKSASFLSKAFVVALFMMTIILVTQFNSFYSTFLILSAVVMSTIGVMIGLLVTGQPFGIVMSGIGVIALAGIIVNNNIVLIDTFDYLRRTYGYDTKEAILRTGAQRLRPVILTTVTTVIGLMPMALQLNIDFLGREISHGAPSTQWWVQLSTAIVFGLTFSTLLTLFFTPAALMLRENFLQFFAKKIKKSDNS